MEIYGITDTDERFEFVYLIQEMDSAYLTERAEILKRARNSPSKSNSRR